MGNKLCLFYLNSLGWYKPTSTKSGFAHQTRVRVLLERWSRGSYWSLILKYCVCSDGIVHFKVIAGSILRGGRVSDADSNEDTPHLGLKVVAHS